MSARPASGDDDGVAEVVEALLVHDAKKTSGARARGRQILAMMGKGHHPYGSSGTNVESSDAARSLLSA